MTSAYSAGQSAFLHDLICPVLCARHPTAVTPNLGQGSEGASLGLGLDLCMFAGASGSFQCRRPQGYFTMLVEGTQRIALAPEGLVLEVIINLNKSGWQAPLLCM